MPEFDSRNPNADWLDYLDIVPIVEEQINGANQISELMPYSEIDLAEDPGIADNLNNSANAQTRREDKNRRLE